MLPGHGPAEILLAHLGDGLGLLAGLLLLFGRRDASCTSGRSSSGR